MTRSIEDLVLLLSKKYKLPRYLMREIVESPFRCVKDVMAKGEGENVKLPYFGKFAIPPTKVPRFKQYLENVRKLKGNSTGPVEQNNREEKGDSPEKARDL